MPKQNSFLLAYYCFDLPNRQIIFFCKRLITESVDKPIAKYFSISFTLYPFFNCFPQF